MKPQPSKHTFWQRYKNGKIIAPYNAIIAGLIDELYTTDANSRLQILIRATYARLLLIAFIPLSLINATQNYLSFICYKALDFFGLSSVNKKLFGERSKAEFLDQGRKSLLGFLFSPFAFIDPNFFAVYFVPKQNFKKKVIAGGQSDYQKATLVQPKSIDEVVDIIKQANENNTKVSVIGAGQSQGGQFLPASQQGMVLDLTQMQDVSIRGKIATITGAVTWAKLQQAANAKGLALSVMQASNVFQVFSSISANIHGWDHTKGVLANCIKELTIVTPTGELKVVKPSDPLFKMVVGGYGQAGIIVKAKLKLEPNIKLTEKSELVPIDNYVKHFEENIATNKDIKMHLYRLSLDPSKPLLEGVAVNYIADKYPTRIINKPLEHEGPQGRRFERIMINFGRRFDFARRWFWNYEKNRLLNNETVATRNEVMKPPINAMFNNAQSETEWLQEYFIPGNNLEKFLQCLSKVLQDNNVKLINATVRYVKQDTISNLPYASENRYAVVLCFNQKLTPDEIAKTKQWIRKATDLALKNKGSYYLPYQPFATQKQFAKSYPMAEQFAKNKSKLDPNNVLSTRFSSQYLTKNNPTVYHKLMQSKALQKKFSGFLTNVLVKIEPKKFYALLADVLKTNDTEEEIYAQMLKRMSEIQPGFVDNVKLSLKSLNDIQHDLTEQVADLTKHISDKPINGIMEIGYPARFIKPLRARLNIQGPAYVVNYDPQSLADLAQCGFPRPYDMFDMIKGNGREYKPLDPQKFPDNSVDMVTCFIGLHHVPANELDDFLASIRRVLRPGGKFMLVDHDAHDPTSHLMAELAHRTFNMVNGVPLQSELKELRNFKSIKEWQEILQKHGFECQTATPKVRTNDPSLNSMLCFSAKPFVSNELHQARDPLTPRFSERLRSKREQPHNPVPKAGLAKSPSLV